jgi:hypothetical protein
VADSVTGITRIDIAEAACYYSGNCHLSPYNSQRGDAYYNMDARLAKNIKMGEGRNLQLIFQAFNLFNHANYGNDFGSTNNTLSIPNANLPPSQQFQISSPEPTFTNPVGFINPSSSLLPRAFTAEFGARFSF